MNLNNPIIVIGVTSILCIVISYIVSYWIAKDKYHASLSSGTIILVILLLILILILENYKKL